MRGKRVEIALGHRTGKSLFGGTYLKHELLIGLTASGRHTKN